MNSTWMGMHLTQSRNLRHQAFIQYKLYDVYQGRAEHMLKPPHMGRDEGVGTPTPWQLARMCYGVTEGSRLYSDGFESDPSSKN
ncbi:hypothetical protein ACTXT7_003791 [Hymenolepis weldensis]